MYVGIHLTVHFITIDCMLPAYTVVSLRDARSVDFDTIVCIESPDNVSVNRQYILGPGVR